MSPYDVVRQFESALTDYTGARYCVAVTSCTSALLLAVYHMISLYWKDRPDQPKFSIPKFTYVGVAQSILNAGAKLEFRDQEWVGEYEMNEWAIWDCARWLRSGMYRQHSVMCLSFHHTKHLGISTHGGAILCDTKERYDAYRRLRFDGRAEGVEPKDDHGIIRGWHCYMTPATAAEGLMRLAVLPKHNEPLPWGPGTASDYPDLSQLEIFK